MAITNKQLWHLDFYVPFINAPILPYTRPSLRPQLQNQLWVLPVLSFYPTLHFQSGINGIYYFKVHIRKTSNSKKRMFRKDCWNKIQPHALYYRYINVSQWKDILSCCTTYLEQSACWCCYTATYNISLPTLTISWYWVTSLFGLVLGGDPV